MTSEVTSVRVELRHLRLCKPRAICHGGARKWWARQGLDWADFVANGIDSSVLTATRDGLALRVVKTAEMEASGGL